MAIQDDNRNDSRRRRFAFGRRMRIRGEKDFQRVYEVGRRTRRQRLLVVVAANDLGHPRLGVAVPKRYGTAVARNGIRRRIREAFRLAQHELPSADIICSPGLGFDEPVERIGQLLVKVTWQLMDRRDKDGEADR